MTCKCGCHACSHILGHFGNECAVCECKAFEPAFELQNPDTVAAELKKTMARMSGPRHEMSRDLLIELRGRCECLKWVLKWRESLHD